MKSSTRIAIACGVFFLSCVIGVVWGRMTARARIDPELVALSLSVAEAIDQDRVERIWDLLDGETRSTFAASHAILRTHVAELTAQQADLPMARRSTDAIAELEKRHGMSIEDILDSTPASLWVHYVRKNLGAREVRPEFARGVMEDAKHDLHRATARLVLPDGRVQGHQFIRRDDVWWLLEFQPYWDVNRWPVMRSPGSVRR